MKYNLVPAQTVGWKTEEGSPEKDTEQRKSVSRFVLKEKLLLQCFIPEEGVLKHAR